MHTCLCFFMAQFNHSRHYIRQLLFSRKMSNSQAWHDQQRSHFSGEIKHFQKQQCIQVGPQDLEMRSSYLNYRKGFLLSSSSTCSHQTFDRFFSRFDSRHSRFKRLIMAAYHFHSFLFLSLSKIGHLAPLLAISQCCFQDQLRVL